MSAIDELLLRNWHEMSRQAVMPLPRADAPAWFAAAKEAFEHDDGPPDICHCGDSGCIRTFEHAIALRAENERLKAQLADVTSDRDSWKRCTELHQKDLDELYKRYIALRQAVQQAGEERSGGPSWLERVAAGPQRIGRPLP